MNNKTFFLNPANATIEINRTNEFDNAAKELGDYIARLPLSHEQNDKLIELMLKQVNAAEEGSFLHGFKLGNDIGKHES